MKVLILLLALSFSSIANSLIIKNTSFIKVEKRHQFRVEFRDDNGSSVDVTSEASFSVNSGREISPGLFLFSLPNFNRGEMIYSIVKVSYQNESGLHTASTRISIDPTPDYIQVSGPFFLQSNGFYQFRAYGYYNGRAYDLTNNGNWLAFRGSAMSSGFYRAPTMRRGERPIQDSLIFSFGRGRYTKSLTIRSN